MDEQFDRLSRIMAGSLPRRKTLQLIAGAVAGMGVAALGIVPARINDVVECDGCCPKYPAKCDDVCIHDGFKKGSCGGLSNDECICSH